MVSNGSKRSHPFLAKKKKEFVNLGFHKVSFRQFQSLRSYVVIAAICAFCALFLPQDKKCEDVAIIGQALCACK